MAHAGREPSHAEETGDVEQIASSYLVESGGDPHRALRRIIADALADLHEIERRSWRLISRGYVRGRSSKGAAR